MIPLDDLFSFLGTLLKTPARPGLSFTGIIPGSRTTRKPLRQSGDHDLPFGGDETAARLRAKLPNPDGSDDSQLPCGEPANDLAMPVSPKCAPRRCWLDGPWAAKYLKS
jgi:hypothetical protein